MARGGPGNHSTGAVLAQVSRARAREACLVCPALCHGLESKWDSFPESAHHCPEKNSDGR